MIRIEPLAAHPELASELGALHFAEWGALEPDESVEERAAWLRACPGRGHFPTGFVAVEGTTLCGSALLVADDLSLRPDLTPWLAGVYVKPAYRRAGLATKLVQAIVDEATAQSRLTLYLYTESSEALYARLGFRPIERCLFQGKRIVIMKREQQG